MPETDSDCSKVYLRVESGGSASLKRISSGRCRVHVFWIVVPFVALLALQAAFWYLLLYRAEAKPHITVVIDLNGTQNCMKDVTNERACKRSRLFVSSKDPIGPLRCHDDAFAQSEIKEDNCKGNRFRIARNGLGVVIPQDGLYRLYAKIAYYDSIPHHTSMQVRIDSPYQTECLGKHNCLAAREEAAHNWLTCQAHQPSTSGRPSPAFTSCAVDGIRRFKAGQTVGLQVSIGYREIVGHFKATYMYIHML